MKGMLSAALEMMFRAASPARLAAMLTVLFSGFAWGAESSTNSPPGRDIFDISLEELKRMNVTGASKREQKVSEAPAAVTVLTSEDIKRFGYRTLADMLQTVPGLSVSYDRNRALLGSRGFNPGDANNRILILVDGHRVNHNLRDEGYIGTDELLDVDLIDTVEVIRGPGSVLYGNNAFFGVINIHTRRGRELEQVEGSAEAGEFGTYKGRITINQEFKNGVDLILSGSYYTSQGEPRYYDRFFDNRLSGLPAATHNGVADDADGDQYRSFFGALSYRDFTLEGGYLTRDKINPTAPAFTAFNDARSKWSDEREYVNLKYVRHFPDLFDLTASISYDRNDFGLGYFFVGPPALFYNETQTGEWWGSEVQLSREFFDRLNVTLGGEYRDDFNQELRLVERATGLVGADLRRTTANHGVFLQADLMIVTNLHLNAGLRYDQYGKTDPALNPRLALIYNPWKEAAFKAVYGSAFRAPNFFELNDPRFQDIRPETITSYELVYEQDLTDHLRSTASVFYNEIEDLITFNGVRYQNLNNASAKGTELGLEAYWPNGFRGRVSYTYQETRDGTTGARLTDSPRHMAKASISIPVWKDQVFASPEVLFMSERSTWMSTTVDPYAVVNFTVFSRRLAKGLELSASVYNLFDEQYSDPSRQALHRQDQIMQTGRTYRLKLVYAF